MIETTIWAAMLLGFILGCGVTAFGVWMHLKKPDLSKIKQFTPALVAALAFTVLLSAVSPTLAQTSVPLEIPTDVIFTETNNWIETFAPIAAIGIGITVALAVLGYLGKMIASAFKG